VEEWSQQQVKALSPKIIQDDVGRSAKGSVELKDIRESGPKRDEDVSFSIKRRRRRRRRRRKGRGVVKVSFVLKEKVLLHFILQSDCAQAEAKVIAVHVPEMRVKRFDGFMKMDVVDRIVGENCLCGRNLMEENVSHPIFHLQNEGSHSCGTSHDFFNSNIQFVKNTLNII
jgi:hypothetical protein